jgi:tetratricopeptide (TPR) repeat protein
VWQSLAESVKEAPFVVLAVALDHAAAARPWIEAAKPSYPCLIDDDHRVAELYNLVNVPQAVWIDEAGRIVRPGETAGMNDSFRGMDRKTFQMSEQANAERARVKKAYMAAVADWARRGAASPHALDEARVRARLQGPDAAVAEAHARFRLGLALVRAGQESEAAAQFEQAARLHPDSWAIWRRAAPKDGRGLASGPAFWARVDALGAKAYYPPSDVTAG